MIAFLLMFLLIYGLLHLLFYLKVRTLIPHGILPQFLVIGSLTLMLFAPVAVRLLERSGHEHSARILAFVGYSWMGFLFLADCLFLLGISFHLLLRVIGNFIPLSPLVSFKALSLSVLAVASLVWIYGFLDARNIRVERVSIETSKLPEGVDQLKIVQISDLHLGLLNRSGRLERILECVRSENPDLLVSTGDLVDGNMGGYGDLADLFERVRPRYGKIAITGNHEAYAGLQGALETTVAFGFKILRGEAVTVKDLINVVGVDDPVVDGRANERDLLASVRNGKFTLFLKHRPEVSPESLGLFDLQISGHTHRGQIFPFSLVTGRVYPMQNGLYHLENGSKLYTSRGTGTWGPPIRVLSPPEVTLITLVRKTH